MERAAPTAAARFAAASVAPPFCAAVAAPIASVLPTELAATVSAAGEAGLRTCDPLAAFVPGSVAAAACTPP